MNEAKPLQPLKKNSGSHGQCHGTYDNHADRLGLLCFDPLDREHMEVGILDADLVVDLLAAAFPPLFGAVNASELKDHHAIRGRRSCQRDRLVVAAGNINAPMIFDDLLRVWQELGLVAFLVLKR